MSPSPSNPPRSEAEQIELLTKKLQWAEWKIRALEERLRLELIKKYGPKSEKLSDAQMQLLELEPGGSASRCLQASPATAINRKSGKHPGRQELPADLPRVDRLIAC